jgi:hypothetical protein
MKPHESTKFLHGNESQKSVVDAPVFEWVRAFPLTQMQVRQQRIFDSHFHAKT